MGASEGAGLDDVIGKGRARKLQGLASFWAPTRAFTSVARFNESPRRLWVASLGLRRVRLSPRVRVETFSKL
jgi:hypothetical protein